MRNRLIVAGASAALAALVFPVVHRPTLRLVWNASPSVPLGLYGIVPPRNVAPGQLVAVRPPRALARFMDERGYVEAGALLVKPVAAVGGASICRHGIVVTINGHRAAVARVEDRGGRPLPRWDGCRRLEHNELFLIAPATADSFDSRYFGAVRRENVVGRAVPLLLQS